MRKGSSEFRYTVEQSEGNFYFVTFTFTSSVTYKDYIPLERESCESNA